MRHIRVFLLSGFLLAHYPIFGQTDKGVRVWEDTIVLPTYPIHPPDPNPMFFRSNSYQGASAEIYPYPLINNLSDQREAVSYKALFLENEYHLV